MRDVLTGIMVILLTEAAANVSMLDAQTTKSGGVSGTQYQRGEFDKFKIILEFPVILSQ